MREGTSWCGTQGGDAQVVPSALRCCCAPPFIFKKLICKLLLSESSFLPAPNTDGAAAICPTHCLTNKCNKTPEGLCGD